MCNTALHHRRFGNVVEPFTFSPFHLLRTCNQLMLPNTDNQSYCNIIKESNSNDVFHGNTKPLTNYSNIISSSTPTKSPLLDVIETQPSPNSSEQPDVDQNSTTSRYDAIELNDKTPLIAGQSSMENNNTILNGASMFRSNDRLPMNLPNHRVFPMASNSLLTSKSPLPAFEYINHPMNPTDFPLMELNRVGVFPAFVHRRPRGEKRPIPEEQKDDKYYERRKRNNEAAKKSRDARKIREDRIAFRAALLEQENSILRTQVMALRDELQAMRQLITRTSATIGSKNGGPQL